MYTKKKNFNNRRFSTKRKSDYMENPTYTEHGQPSKEKVTDVYLAAKALRGLPHNSVSVKADPYTDSLPGSNPYALINVFNKLTGGKYSGDSNIDGGNVQQYANSTLSKFLAYFDFIRTKANVNYRLVPFKPYLNEHGSPETHYPGRALIDEMRKAIAETVSIMQSTTFTSMAINNFKIETDLPMGSAEGVATGDPKIFKYDSLTDVMYGCLMYYQAFLQQILNSFKWHNSFRFKMGTMIRSAWNREVPSLNSLFGLFQKKSFIAMLNSLALSFEGEYIDTEFSEQAGLLNVCPSRRSNSITDPVIEMQTKFELPEKFRIYVEVNGEEEDIFNSDDLTYTGTLQGEPKIYNFEEVIDIFNTTLSCQDTMRWARNATIGNEDLGRFNDAKKCIDAIQSFFTYFKTNMADVREALDVCNRAGIVNWKKGYRPAVTNDTDKPLFRNLIIDDILKTMFAGCPVVKMNLDTKRWTIYSLWNMYDGIPEYDLKNGGSFLSFSFRDILDDNDEDHLIDYIARPFTVDTNLSLISMEMTARDGVTVEVGTQLLTNAGESVIFGRLFPLRGQNSMSLKVPYLIGNVTGTATSTHISTLYKTLTQIFGICHITSTTLKIDDYAADPDLLAIYQVEIEDITNEAITYARSKGPFLGTTSTSSVIGFTSGE